MHTLIENILFIFLRALETGRKRVFDKLFCPVSQRVVMNYYVYCVYPAMLKSLKQLPNCLERAETSIALIIFYGCSRQSKNYYYIFCKQRYFLSYFCPSLFQNAANKIFFLFSNLILSETQYKTYVILYVCDYYEQ